MEQTDLLHLETPCFVLDKKELERSVKGFRNALSTYFPSFVLAYSVKTNSLPYSLKLFNQLGTYAEVVSYDEYNLALACGFPKNHLIYNGPMKSKETFIDAIVNGAIVNIETKREIDWLSDLPTDRIYSVGIRLNINISQISPEDADGDNDNSRFGFSDETGDFVQAIESIHLLPHIQLVGLHIHRTSHSRSIRFYQHSIAFACKMIKKYKLNISYLDIGGGYFGIFADKPTYDDYCKVFKDVLLAQGCNDLKIIVEPGNGLIASALSFVSQIIDVKHMEKHTYFITTDGSRMDIDPFFKKQNYIKNFIFSDKSDRPVAEEQIISGCTCLEYDRMFSINSQPLLKVGDCIHYHNVGAYTMALSPLFIRYIPNVYVYEDGKYRMIRQKWSETEYMKNSLI